MPNSLGTRPTISYATLFQRHSRQTCPPNLQCPLVHSERWCIPSSISKRNISRTVCPGLDRCWRGVMLPVLIAWASRFVKSQEVSYICRVNNGLALIERQRWLGGINCLALDLSLFVSWDPGVWDEIGKESVKSEKKIPIPQYRPQGNLWILQLTESWNSITLIFREWLSLCFRVAGSCLTEETRGYLTASSVHSAAISLMALNCGLIEGYNSIQFHKFVQGRGNRRKAVARPWLMSGARPFECWYIVEILSSETILLINLKQKKLHPLQIAWA